MASDRDQSEGLSKTLLAFLALVPAIATAITGYLAYRVNSEVQGLNAELQRIQSERAFDMDIYRVVKESLKGDAKDQEVAIALVVSIGREPLRTKLLKVLEEASSPEIVAEARSYRMMEKQADSAPEASAAAPGTTAWANWDFDLFYCEASPDRARAQADKLASAMQADGAEGRIRVRPLSDSKNREGQYQINGYAIYRSEDEAAMGDKLAAFAKNILQADGVSFDVKSTSQRSPWYISAFLCPDSGV